MATTQGGDERASDEEPLLEGQAVFNGPRILPSTAEDDDE